MERLSYKVCVGFCCSIYIAESLVFNCVFVWTLSPQITTTTVQLLANCSRWPSRPNSYANSQIMEVTIEARHQLSSTCLWFECRPTKENIWDQQHWMIMIPFELVAYNGYWSALMAIDLFELSWQYPMLVSQPVLLGNVIVCIRRQANNRQTDKFYWFNYIKSNQNLAQ